MAINFDDLPPKYREQVQRKIVEQEQRGKRKTVSPTLPGSRKASKYHNSPTERVTAAGAVIRFDSQREARRYDELMTWLNAGAIQDLRLQVDFTLQEAYTDLQGCRIRAIRYRADFTYFRPAAATGEGRMLVVEDVKSQATRTKEYLLKRKLMKDRFGIDIVEV